MYVLAKFQFHILKTFQVTALQSSSNRKTNFYSKYRENELQAITKTDVTYECNDVQHCNQTKIFEFFLLQWKRWYPGFNCWPLPSPRKRYVRKLRIFSKYAIITKYAIIHSGYFNAYSEKICIMLVCSDPVTFSSR